jgi:tRNA(Ile)-lysidine synthase
MTSVSHITAAEADALFAPLIGLEKVVVALSGGPDSTALLWLLARWRSDRRDAPDLIAVTVDHGLRPEAAAEARAAKALAASLGVPHRTRRWRGDKPTTGLQAAAREARYRLLADAAAALRAQHVVTAHTQDDQAETVAMRLLRGSGVTGLGGMTPATPRGAITLLRPLLGVPKARLLATLDEAGIGFVRDPSNTDDRFLRPRLRALLPALAQEGLDAPGWARFAARMRRADAALEAAADAAEAAALRIAPACTQLDAWAWAALPAEIRLRLLVRAIGRAGEGAQLGPAETLEGEIAQAIAGKTARLRRTLGGALISLRRGVVQIEPAPPRRRPPTGGARLAKPGERLR